MDQSEATTAQPSEHLQDAGIKLAASLAGFDRAEALYVLDYAHGIVSKLFEEHALPPKWRQPRQDARQQQAA